VELGGRKGERESEKKIKKGESGTLGK